MRCAGPPYAGRPDELVLQRMKKAHTNITGTTRDFHMATNARCAARPTLFSVIFACVMCSPSDGDVRQQGQSHHHSTSVRRCPFCRSTRMCVKCKQQRTP